MPPLIKILFSLSLGILVLSSPVYQWNEPIMSLSHTTILGTETRVSQRSGQTSEQFLSGTEQGRIVLAYLRCSDFDCVEALNTVLKLGSDIVQPLVRLLHNPVPQMIAPDLPKGKLRLLVRTKTITALGELKDERAVAVLLEATRDLSPQIRGVSAEALGKISGDRALAGLIPLLKDHDQLVRETTAKALGRLRRPEALAALREAAQKESATHVRTAMKAAIKSIQER